MPHSPSFSVCPLEVDGWPQDDVQPVQPLLQVLIPAYYTVVQACNCGTMCEDVADPVPKYAVRLS